MSDSLLFLEEVFLRRRLNKESVRLGKLAKRAISGLSRRLLARASEEALSRGSSTTLRMASQIGVLVAKLKPKAIVITHEGMHGTACDSRSTVYRLSACCAVSHSASNHAKPRMGIQSGSNTDSGNCLQSPIGKCARS